MPDAPDHPIAYTALQPGTPVQTSDGQHFAAVQAVLVDEKVAVFDGIAQSLGGINDGGVAAPDGKPDTGIQHVINFDVERLMRGGAHPPLLPPLPRRP